MNEKLREAATLLVLEWFKAERAERGDFFATASEMEFIESDPLAWLSMVRGVDAYELIRRVIG